MSWNLLTFAAPAWSLLKVFVNTNPASYKQFDDLPESDQTLAATAIVTRILNAENVPGAEHFERIQDMLKEIPESAGPKRAPALKLLNPYFDIG